MKKFRYEKLICTSCGAPIDPVRMICPYCGSRYFKAEDYDGPPRMVVRTENPQVQTLIARVEYPSDKRLTAVQVSKMAIEDLSYRLAEAIGPYLTLESGQNMTNGNIQITGKIRLVSPDFRF